MAQQLNTSKRAEIDQLISSLSSWDLIYMRHRLRLANIQLAGLEDAPQELVCLIAAHLQIEDILACRLVSKSWVGAWSQDAVLVSVCRRFFPGVSEMEQEHPKKLLLRAINRQKREYRSVHFERDAVYWNASWDTARFRNVAPRPKSIPESSQDAQVSSARIQHPVCYADGKIAWQPRRDLIIVDDLDEKTRRRVVCPQLEEPWACQLGGLSKQLVVVFAINDAHKSSRVHIYHLEHKEYKILHLPNLASLCFVQGERVGAVAVDSQVVIWSWTGKATQLDIDRAGLPDTTRDFVPRLILHPTEPSVFVVQCHRHFQPDRRLCTIEVVKFEHGRVVWRAVEPITNPLQDLDHDCLTVTSWVQLSFSLKKADNYGTFTLALHRLQGQQFASHARDECHGPWKSGDLGALNFNVFGQTFQHHHYHWRGGELIWDPAHEYTPRANVPHNLLEDLCVWNSRLTLVWSHQLSRDEKLKLYMVAINPLGSVPECVMYRPFNVDNQESGFVGPLFQDDDRVLIPTRRRLWLLAPKQVPPLEKEWNLTIENPQNDQLHRFTRVKCDVVIEMRHKRSRD